ncbi:hypothetical protein [Flavobacterium limnosediminis]|uniref:hypothetical protein n=1 Tax=Flavobacterium limnosediminis TaxID=1401027 RepID=UPI00041C3F60|nr:hypothetical protein [Flavobacterium limnosediminis]
MQDSINITGTSAIDLIEKRAAIETLLKNASTKELVAVAEFSKDEKAKTKVIGLLTNPKKLEMLKKFL